MKSVFSYFSVISIVVFFGGCSNNTYYIGSNFLYQKPTDRQKLINDYWGGQTPKLVPAIDYTAQGGNK